MTIGRKIKKKDNGNITILILVIALVVIIGTASMLGYVFRNIKFTELDEENLRAFNFAEAGIANFQSKLRNYFDGQLEALPESGYSIQVTEGGENQGSFTISYTEAYDNGNLIGYNVISNGIDKSGSERTVKVFINITGGDEIDIYDYIYSSDPMNSGDVSASQTSIHGPFYTNGVLNLRGSVKFLEGPLYVREDITLGGNSYIGYPSVGGESNSIILYLGGLMYDVNGQLIDPINPDKNDNVYVYVYYTNVMHLPMIVIDQDYIDGLTNKTYVTGDLEISENSITGTGLDSSYLYFDDNGILQINGNIIVDGNVYIGSSSGGKASITYEGKGKIISKLDTSVYYKLTPTDISTFPENDLLLLMSMSDMYLDFGKSSGDPDGVFLAIANNNLKLEEGTYFRGSLIAKHLIIDNNSDIYYESNLRDFLPDDLPESTVGYGSIIIENWQEIKNE